MCPYARRVSDFLLLMIVEMPWRALPYSWSWVSSHGNGIENIATLLPWESGSHLYGPQKLKIHLHSNGLEHEIVMMDGVNQGVWFGCAHPGKANVVADALSCKADYNNFPGVPLTRQEYSIRVLLDMSLLIITLTPILREDIIAAQKNDEGMTHIRRRMQEGNPKVNCFREDAEGTLWFKDRLVVPNKALKKKILDRAHTSTYSIHPGSIKMYHDLR
jgi:hypothetical protein